jgi:hypothetical protein
MPAQIDVGAVIISIGSGLITILMVMIGWNVKMLWGALKELRESHVALDNRERENAQDAREHCARCVAGLPSVYVRRDEIMPRLDRMETEIKSMIARLFDELKSKADK